MLSADCCVMLVVWVVVVWCCVLFVAVVDCRLVVRCVARCGLLVGVGVARCLLLVDMCVFCLY